MMQVVGIIVAADVLLVSYGISQRVSAILLVASFTPIIILIALFVIFDHAYPIIIVVMRIEDRLSLGEYSLANTYTRMRLAPMYPHLRSQVGSWRVAPQVPSDP
jgi:phosphoglycerol transferase MdoB-like AlkP superfamily enzyme